MFEKTTINRFSYRAAALALLILSSVAYSAPDESQELAALRERMETLHRAAKFSEELPLAEKALTASETSFGPDHPETAKSLRDLGEVYVGMHDYAKAEPLHQRALKIDGKALGPEHPDTAKSLNSLANLYFRMADYAKAKPLYERALTIREKALGPEHPDTAKSLNILAALYGEMGDYAKAEPLAQRALTIREKALGPEHPDTAKSLNLLARLYGQVGDYAKAEPLCQRALKIDEKALGPEHVGTTNSLNNLGDLYVDIGDYAKAGPLAQRVLKICEKAFGPEHPSTAASLANLALTYHKMGDYAKAEPLFQRALKIYEKAFGSEHPDIGTALASLADLYDDLGDYAKAEALNQRSLTICEKALGPEHPNTATSLNSLAKLYVHMGNYAKAEPLYQRALKIYEKTLGSGDPRIATSLNNLALLHKDIGNAKEALHLAAQARQVQEKLLTNILSFTSEQQRLAIQKTTNPYTLPASLGSAPELSEIVLRQKGVVLDSLLEDRLVADASADPKQRDAITEVRSAKQRLMKLLLEVPKDLSDEVRKRQEAEKEALSKRVEELESGLAREVAGLGKARRALSVTVKQVQAILGKEQVLIELIRYDHYLGKNKSEPRYGAIVISFSGEPKWVSLGSAPDIEKNIKLYQKSARGTTDEETLRNALHTLFAQIWSPIERSLPGGTRRIVLSPDGQLNFISFATLLGADDTFVAEKYFVSYVASGRDLLKETKPSSSQAMLVYANPDFGGKAVAQSGPQSSAIVLRSLEMRDLEGLSLPPLPGTAVEAAALEKRAGKSAKVFLGLDATEAELRQVNSPHILHLATHGFFLPEMELGNAGKSARSPEDIPKGKLVNPMHRSGLALAGAQRTLEDWNRGEVPPTENDGIVTAEEVGGLKLDNTWLAVLSACDTGSGEARAGEGVMGLRRGFIQAGVQNFLMTLWPISDETTVQIVLDFYDAAEKTKNAPQALAETQRDWLIKLRKERGLLDAVRLAGPFIMSSQGKQQ